MHILSYTKIWAELDIKLYDRQVIDMECSTSKPTLSGSTAEWNTNMKITRNLLHLKPWQSLGLQVLSNIIYITHRKVGITYVTHTGKYTMKYWVEFQCIHQNLLTLITVSCTMSINSEYMGVSKEKNFTGMANWHKKIGNFVSHFCTLIPVEMSKRDMKY